MEIWQLFLYVWVLLVNFVCECHEFVKRKYFNRKFLFYKKVFLPLFSLFTENGTFPLFPHHITRHQAVEKESPHYAYNSPTTYCEHHTSSISHLWGKCRKDLAVKYRQLSVEYKGKILLELGSSWVPTLSRGGNMEKIHSNINHQGGMMTISNSYLLYCIGFSVS